MAVIERTATTATARTHGPNVVREQPGRYMSGFPIGILRLNSTAPNVPGAMGNAATFDFPVYNAIAEQGSYDNVKSGRPEYAQTLISAAQDLERQGVSAIVGECGFMLPYQEAVAAAVKIPVFLSSLLLLPLLGRAVPASAHIGVVTAELRAWNQWLRGALQIDMARLSIAGLEERPAWHDYYFEEVGVLDPEAAQRDVVAAAREVVERDSAVRLILLECGATPRYAAAVRKATNLPVADFMTLTRMAHDLVVKATYA
jgi:hypothetical protein